MVERLIGVRRRNDLLEYLGKYLAELFPVPWGLMHERRPFAKQKQIAVCPAGIAEPECLERRNGLLLRGFRVQKELVVFLTVFRRGLFCGVFEQVVIDGP